MSKDGKTIIAWISGIALLLAIWVFMAPVLQAKLRYGAVADGDDFERCAAAEQLADAWAGAGFGTRYEYWKSQAGTACALGRLRASAP